MAELVPIELTVNGRRRALQVAAHHSLLDVLRDDLQLTGTKECCLVGECGACTVSLDGRVVDSCLVLAVEADGSAITTIEGIARPEGLHPLQQAFLEQAALQCGICTPGFIVSAKALLDRHPDPTEEAVRHWLAGNLCRCTGYDKIVRAVLAAAAIMRDGADQQGEGLRQPAHAAGSKHQADGQAA